MKKWKKRRIMGAVRRKRKVWQRLILGAMFLVGIFSGSVEKVTAVGEENVYLEHAGAVASRLVADESYYRLSEEQMAGLELKSEKFYLYDLTDGREFYAARADERAAVASLTKMMTALVFLENHPDTAELDQTITITGEMLYTHEAYTRMGLTEGQVVTVRDMLYGLMLPSAADAANALAFYDAGSVEAFVMKMNQKVAEMGLMNTHFSNPYGMDEADTVMIYPNMAEPANYSTARECEKILERGLKNATFREIFEGFYYTTSYGEEIKKSATTYVDGIAGLKTGYTAEAKRCLASNARIDGKEFLLVNLGAEEVPDHLTDATKIYNLVDESFDAEVVAKAGEKVADVPIKWGKEEKYEVKLAEDVVVYTKREEVEQEVSTEFQGVSEIAAGVLQGDEIGKVVVKRGEIVMAEVPVVL
ncbi:MAG: hypothetical protein Q4F60_03385, partial [Candidatus Saccharibacteria bacterium]|nr:hypothetical protein [Candidatus Saccharibacteria bacterium]